MQGTEQMTVTPDALRLTIARLERRALQGRAQAGASWREPGSSRNGGLQARGSPRNAQAGSGLPGADTDATAHARARQAAIAAAEARPGAVLRFGIAAIDAHLPGGGLNRAALHELAGAGADTEHAAIPALLVAALLAHHPGQVVWATERRDLFAPALAAVGLHPDRIVFVEAGRSVLAAMEEGLRHPGLAAVVGEISGPIGLTASRRLQLRAEAGVPAFVLRRSRRFDDPLLSAPLAAATRWRVASLHTRPVRIDAPDLPGVARARWRLDLVRCRGGVPSSWTLEACDAQNRLGMAAELRHGPAAVHVGNDGKGGDLHHLGSADEAGQVRSGRSRAAAGAVAA